jgi:hypothetical protein
MAEASAAMYSAMVQTIKASVDIVRLEADGFMTIVSKTDKPLVVMAHVG